MSVVTAEPWARVRRRDPLPRPLTVRSVRELTDREFAELVRQNLLPDDAQRDMWARLWSILALDPGLSRRAETALDELAGMTEDAIQDGLDDDREARRAGKFLRMCEDALDRMKRLRSQPLEWAGAAASGFNPAARGVLAKFIDAIDRHRAQVGDEASQVDLDLWQVLDDVGLDPRHFREL